MAEPQALATISSHDVYPLDWSKSNRFYYPDMVGLKTITDGSCFFHAIVKAYFIPYITGNSDGTSFNRQDYIKGLRRDLANKLGERVNPLQPNSSIYYDTLSRGQLRNMSLSVKEYSLENLQSLLNSNNHVGNEFLEFVSDQLGKDIYILDLIQHDVYILGMDDDILYKERDSIVLLYRPSHYDLVGIKSNDGVKTLFASHHPFIQSIRDRMNTTRV